MKKFHLQGTRDEVGKTTNVLVQWEGKKGTMQFWQSYPGFSPKGVEKFTAKSPLTEESVKQAVARWENGHGLSF